VFEVQLENVISLSRNIHTIPKIIVYKKNEQKTYIYIYLIYTRKWYVPSGPTTVVWTAKRTVVHPLTKRVRQNTIHGRGECWLARHRSGGQRDRVGDEHATPHTTETRGAFLSDYRWVAVCVCVCVCDPRGYVVTGRAEGTCIHAVCRRASNKNANRP